MQSDYLKSDNLSRKISKQMHILELTYPGTWLNFGDKELQWSVYNLLKTIESLFTEATMAFNLFELERKRPIKHMNPSDWGEDALRRTRIEEQIRKDLGVHHNDILAHDEIYYRVMVESKREKWRDGELPADYQSCLPFLYAKSFLYALDSIRKCLAVLDNIDGIPQEVHLALSSFENKFPDLQGVRNSSAHLEDRSRGLGKDKKPHKTKPIVNKFIHAPQGGALMLSILNGNRFGSTKADGNYGEIEVSIESLIHV